MLYVHSETKSWSFIVKVMPMWLPVGLEQLVTSRKRGRVRVTSSPGRHGRDASEVGCQFGTLTDFFQLNTLKKTEETETFKFQTRSDELQPVRVIKTCYRTDNDPRLILQDIFCSACLQPLLMFHLPTQTCLIVWLRKQKCSVKYDVMFVMWCEWTEGDEAAACSLPLYNVLIFQDVSDWRTQHETVTGNNK